MSSDQVANPLESLSQSGAGILPVCIHEGDLYVLLQHEIRYQKPTSAKNFGYIDFGGATKKETDTDMYQIAAREFFEEIYHGREQLLPNIDSVEALTEKLKTCEKFIMGKRYVMFVLPVEFVPSCFLGEKLSEEDYRDGKKIQTLWWFPLKEASGKFLPLHNRMRVRGLGKVLNNVKKELLEKAEETGASKECYVQALKGDKKKYKTIYRKFVWETLEIMDQIMFPRPCLNRIPNFLCREDAGRMLADSKEFSDRKNAVVKVNPSLAQQYLRYLTICKGKTLLVPSPALETAFMYRLHRENIKNRDRHFAAEKKGAAKLGEVLSVTSDWSKLHVDIVVVGSVVVCPVTGARLGKGTGWAELEWAILSELGVVDEKTLVATTVHDAQIVHAFPHQELMESHDLSVDIIATPTRVIRIKDKEPRPQGHIQWELIDAEKLAASKVLQEVKDWIEAGKPAPPTPAPDAQPSSNDTDSKSPGAEASSEVKPENGEIDTAGDKEDKTE